MFATQYTELVFVTQFDCSWFKPEDASGLRLRIRELLQEAFESARLDDAMSEAAASDGSYIGDSIKGGELEADAPSDSSEMVLEFGNTGKRNEGIKVAASLPQESQATLVSVMKASR